MEFLVMDLRDFKLSPSKFWDMYDNGIHFFGESPSKVAFTSPIKLAGAAVENGNTGNRRKDQSGGIHGRFDWSSPLNSRAAEKKHAESKTKESSPSLSTGTTSKINNFDIFTSRNHFPILLLSYVDLIEVSEVLTFLLMHRRDAVLIFAPHFIVGEFLFQLSITAFYCYLLWLHLF